MTDEQRKMIDKLNEDNRKLNDVNKGMKDYAKYRLVVGILVVTIIIALFFVQYNTWFNDGKKRRNRWRSE